MSGRCIQINHNGSCIPIEYKFSKPGSLKAVHLIGRTNTARPPKQWKNTGVGDKEWLISTPFMTAILKSEDNKDIRVLLGVACDEADRIEPNNIAPPCDIFALSEDDAVFIAGGLKMPLLIVSESHTEALVVHSRNFFADRFF